MHNDYKRFLSEQRPSIVEIFAGYRPPSAKSKAPQPLAPDTLFEVIARTENRSLQLIPSRFDFSDSLIGAVRPNPRTLARFLSAHFQEKDLIIIDCSPTESILTTAAYSASGKVLVPVKPEYFATIGFPLLKESIDNFRTQNRGQTLDVLGIVVNNSFYNGGNDGGPEKARAMTEIRTESKRNNWPIYKTQIMHSRGFPKMMRGDYQYSGNAKYFWAFAEEFFRSLDL